MKRMIVAVVLASAGVGLGCGKQAVQSSVPSAPSSNSAPAQNSNGACDGPDASQKSICQPGHAHGPQS